MEKNNYYSVVVIGFKNNQLLGISRCYNHSLFGLIGGKVDDTDNTLEDAIIRECFEETGTVPADLQYVGSKERNEGGLIGVFYSSNLEGVIRQTNEGVVKNIKWSELYNGAFIEENKYIFRLMCRHVAYKIEEFLALYGNHSSDYETFGKYNSPEANTLYELMSMFLNYKVPDAPISSSYIHGGYKQSDNAENMHKKLLILINQFINCCN